jgi:hypothetical protein
MRPIKYVRMQGKAEAEMESAIQSPEFVEQSVEGRINKWRETSGKFLRVTIKSRWTEFEPV